MNSSRSTKGNTKEDPWAIAHGSDWPALRSVPASHKWHEHGDAEPDGEKESELVSAQSRTPTASRGDGLWVVVRCGGQVAWATGYASLARTFCKSRYTQRAGQGGAA